jgi:succinate dehydrogenase / fumarate reductase, cytochrome b subunit
MTIVSRFFNSTLGKKYIMAITGLALFGFVIIHMLGNLQLFAGAEAINEYAHLLKSKAPLLWGARLGLLAFAALHIVGASLSSRTAAISGTIILVFIIYHLLQFTVGVTNPEFLALRDANGNHDVYEMVVRGFSNPIVSIFYLIVMAMLCLHLSHGIASMFQSLGIKNGGYDKQIGIIAKIGAAAIFIGNCAIVISVLAGLVK